MICKTCAPRDPGSGSQVFSTPNTEGREKKKKKMGFAAAKSEGKGGKGRSEAALIFEENMRPYKAAREVACTAGDRVSRRWPRKEGEDRGERTTRSALYRFTLCAL